MYAFQTMLAGIKPEEGGHWACLTGERLSVNGEQRDEKQHQMQRGLHINEMFVPSCTSFPHIENCTT
jgi:hypothetical protein